MSGNGQKVGSIYVALGVDVAGLDKQIGQAKQRVDSISGSKGTRRSITFDVKVLTNQASIAKAAGQIRTNLGKNLSFTPTLHAGSARNFIAGMNKQFRELQSKPGGEILIPIKGLKLNGPALRKQLLGAISGIQVPVEIVFKGGHGGPGTTGGTTSTGGGPASGGGAGGARLPREQRAAERRATVAEREATIAETNVRAGRPAHQTRAEISSANKLAWARKREADAVDRQARTAEKIAQAPAVASAGPSASVIGKRRASAIRAAGGSQQDVRDAAQAASDARNAGLPPPTHAVITGRPLERPPAESGARRRPRTTPAAVIGTRQGNITTFPMDDSPRMVADRTLNARPVRLTPEEQAEATRISALSTRKQRTRKGGIAKAIEANQLALDTGMREAEPLNPMARSLRLAPIGKIPEAHRAQATAARGPGGILSQLTGARQAEMMAAGQTPRANQLREALASVKDEGSFEQLAAIDPHMAEALFAHMSGNFVKAKELSSEWEGGGIEGSHYTFGGAPNKAAKRLKRLRKAQIGKTDPYSQDPVTLLRAGFANAIRGDITAQERPTSQNKKAAAKGNAGVRSRGLIIQQAGAAEALKNISKVQPALSAASYSEEGLPTTAEILQTAQAQLTNVPGGNYYAPAPLEESNPADRPTVARPRAAAKPNLRPNAKSPSAFAGERPSTLSSSTGQRDLEMEARLASTATRVDRRTPKLQAKEAREAAESTARIRDAQERRETWANLDPKLRDKILALQSAPGEHSLELAALMHGHKLPGITGRIPIKPPIPGLAEGGSIKGLVSSRPSPYDLGFGVPKRRSKGFTAPNGNTGYMKVSNTAHPGNREWRKIASASIASHPFCADCGIRRLEASRTGNRLEADHILTERTHPELALDPSNVIPRCRSCNSIKGDDPNREYGPNASTWDAPRPSGISTNTRLGASYEDFRPGGLYFNVRSIRSAISRKVAFTKALTKHSRAYGRLQNKLSRRADGGDVESGFRSGGLLARLLQDPSYSGRAATPEQEARSQLRDVATGFIGGGVLESGAHLAGGVTPPVMSAAADRLLAFREGRAAGGPVWRSRLRPTDYTAAVRGPGADLQPTSWLTSKRQGLGKTYLVGERGSELYVDRHGRSELVGEKGPEIRNFPEDGQIVPHHRLAALPHAASGTPRPRFPAGTPLQGGGRFILPAEQQQIRVAGAAQILARSAGVTPVTVTNAQQIGQSVAAAIGRVSPAAAPAAPRPAAAPAAPRPARARPVARGAPAAPAAAGPAMAPPAGGPGAAAGIPGAAPLAGAAAGGAGRPGRAPKVSALRRVEAREAASQSVEALRERTEATTARIGERLQLAPVRALSVAFGQISQTIVGGRQGILARSVTARRDVASANKAISRLETEQNTLTRLVDERRAITAGTVGTGPGDMFANAASKRAAKDLNIAASRDQQAAVIRQREVATKRQAISEASEKKILTPLQAVRTQIAGLAGIVAGTLTFTVAMAAAQTAMELVGKATSNAADALTGFGITTKTVNTDLAEAVRTRGGDIRGAIGEKAGAIGLGAGVDLSATGVIAGRLSGANNLIAQRDLLRSENFNGQGGANTPQRGLGIGFGNGLVPGFPILQDFQATPGIAEVVAGSLGSKSPNANAALLHSLITRPTGQASVQDIAVIKNFNEVLAKAGSQFQDAGLEFTTSTTDLDKSFKAMTSPESGISAEVAYQFKSAGLILKGVSGNVVASGKEVNQILQAESTGANVPTSKFILDASLKSMQAQVYSIQRQAQYSRDTTIPQQFAANLAAHPLTSGPGVGLTPAGSQTLGLLGPQYAGIDQGTAGAYARGLPAIEAARKTISDQAAVGEQSIRLLGDGPAKDLEALKALGTEIQDIRDRATTLQTGLAQVQWNRSLTLQHRELGDILAMEGKRTANVRIQTGYTKEGVATYKTEVVAATEIGKLQREQLMTSRESERIQLAMSRRALNFSRALSRLSTPGSTAIERASIAREADAQFKYQERLQSNSEKQFKTGIKLQGLEFSRATSDKITELSQAVGAHVINAEINVQSNIASYLEQAAGIKASLLGVSTDVGKSIHDVIETEQTALESAIGTFSTTIDAEVRGRVDAMVKAYKAGLASLIPNTDTSGANSGTGGQSISDWFAGVIASAIAGAGGKNENNHARGTVFDTSGPTSMTVGEAGTEHVAVLRHPRRMNWNGGGRGSGNVSVSVAVNGSWSVRGPGDVDAIAETIARRVEDRLNRRAAIFASVEQ